jgi:carbamoyltransferase
MDALGDKDKITDPINVDIAASTQKLFEECYLYAAHASHSLLAKSGIKTNNLCLTGGTALNCPSNSKVYNEGPFDNLFIEPSCSDEGLAVGSALYLYHHLQGNKLSVKTKNTFISPYFGRTIKEDEIVEALKKFESKIIYKKSNDTTKQAAQDVFSNKVIAWYEGKSEIGPRALGHRSLVSNPTYKDNWKRVNKIKQREWWRPFAPSVLEEEADKWFANMPFPSPYMLFTGQVINSEKIPAITHVDNSSRIQTVNKSSGQYYQMIKEFYKLSKIPLIMNTSFNGPGEPIIETPEQALNFLLNTELDVLYIDGYKVERKL